MEPAAKPPIRGTAGHLKVAVSIPLGMLAWPGYAGLIHFPLLNPL